MQQVLPVASSHEIGRRVWERVMTSFRGGVVAMVVDRLMMLILVTSLLLWRCVCAWAAQVAAAVMMRYWTILEELFGARVRILSLSR